MKRVKELILYQNMEYGELLNDFADTLEHMDGSHCYPLLNRLINFATEYGLEGNLLQAYLTFLLVNHENPYSLACEKQGQVSGSINDLALHDFEIFRTFFHLDFEPFHTIIPKGTLKIVKNYQKGEKNGILSPTIQKAISELGRNLKSSEDAETFKDHITKFYQDFGVGKLGIHRAFRVEDEIGISIAPILSTAQVELSDLVGYEREKQKLIDNTEAFVQGKPANNCLLYGEGGTGKSSSIKAIMNQYYDRGLRLIELYKHQFQYLPHVLSEIKNRNYRFILFMDDLSFEDFETEYKYLKAVIEGGLENKPNNVLIYATSNRRHLIRENFSDRGGLLEDDIHKNDTVQEKLSLADRFGVSIYYGRPNPKEFRQIVEVLADRQGINLPEEILLELANKWQMAHGGLSGRTARQFVDHLSGKDIIS